MIIIYTNMEKLLYNIKTCTAQHDSFKSIPLNSYQKTTNIKWNNLIQNRNRGSLLPGCKYRITDYVCVVKENEDYYGNPMYISANKPFDIIVEALDDHTLSEDAKAIHHLNEKGEPVCFGDNDISRWELKYCLDCDNNRFDWVDETCEGGVIYYMKDEFGNEVPYDFKNIKFCRYFVYTFVTPNDGIINNKLFIENYIKIDVTSSFLKNYKIIDYFYTFDKCENMNDKNKSEDISLKPTVNNNVIKPHYKYNKQYLNNICLFSNGGSINNNSIDYNCKNFTLYSYIMYNNTFGHNNTNVYVYDVYGNFINSSIGSYNSQILIGEHASNFYLGNHNYDLIIWGRMSNCTLDNYIKHCDFIGHYYNLTVGDFTTNIGLNYYDQSIYNLNIFSFTSMYEPFSFSDNYGEMIGNYHITDEDTCKYIWYHPIYCYPEPFTYGKLN